MVILNNTNNNDKFFFYPNTKTIGNSDITVDLNLNIILSGLLIVLLFVSLAGNISTCAVIVRNRSMRTPTNYYLFNLAVVDLVTALCIPFEIYILWKPQYFPIGEIGCRIHFIVWDCLSNCSVLTIFAFTIERYIVITKPFLRQSLVLTSRVKKIVTFNWLLSCLFCLLQVFNVFLYKRDKGIYCLFQVTDKTLIIMSIDLFIFFALPMTVILVIYILIAIKLRETNGKLITSPGNIQRNKNKAVAMLAVAAFFFICWFPYFVLQMMMIIPRFRSDEYFNLWQVFGYLSLVNSYMSTAVNPILYGLMSRKFRQAFKNLFVGRKSMAIEDANHVPALRTTGKTREL
ncbi:PREDICTED: neuromedin-U receptor 2-like isoform X2 [Papilio polytes]|uniref:neuromedin-U receptor 2-like isoform X2 n=1 Tax=Papilio polytes TaxID=76194 RepID=UPI000675EAB1|nr:PREDICTED: neuromedin-U receptor 2-like isoform X2 [Papilio polytes]